VGKKGERGESSILSETEMKIEQEEEEVVQDQREREMSTMKTKLFR